MFSASVTAIALLTLLVASGSAKGKIDCSKFPSQEEAQVWLDEHPSYTNVLDGDGDGIACENVPSGIVKNPGPKPTPIIVRDYPYDPDEQQGMPEGMPQTGGGRSPSGDTASTTQLTALVALIVVGLSGGALIARHR